jgi:2-polyprenyl-6-hydroxyphenyl methylase/3-demethylubiquinone-9 3-methyltransferase
MADAPSVDPAELARFAALSASWWDEQGPMAPLHKLNPTRLAWIKQQVCDRFGRRGEAADALTGLCWLDVGCGAGILAEPLARMGAEVTAIDPAPEIIAAAELHARAAGVAVAYRAVTAEALAAEGAGFDVVTALEVVEHVNDVPAFVSVVGGMVKPGGLLVASTINRTLKAFALAIVGAEYLLRWLPRGTHTYDRLVTPQELTAAFRRAGLSPAGETGVAYAPLADAFRLTGDLDVNYMMAAARAGAAPPPAGRP